MERIWNAVCSFEQERNHQSEKISILASVMNCKHSLYQCFSFWSLILAVFISWSGKDLCGKLLRYPSQNIIWAGETPIAEWAVSE